MIITLPDIRTAVTEPEAALLAEVCEGKRVLELGAELGFTTVVIGQVCESLVSVDWHRGYKPGSLHGLGEQWTGLAWAHYVEQYLPGTIGRKVTGVFGQFETVLPMLRSHRFDVVFLDGGHERSGLLITLPMVKRLGAPVFVTHDWDEPRCEEKAVLTEVMRWTPDQVVGTLAVGGPL